MPVFFFLSGYLYRRHEDVFIDEIKSNVRSLIVPFFLLSILAGIITIPIFCYTGNLSVLYQRVYETLIGSGNGLAGPAWFLWCLFWIKFIGWFAFQSKYTFFYVIASIALAYTIGSFVYFDVSSAFAAFPFFFLGWVVKRKNYIQIVKRNYWFLILMITAPLLYFTNKLMGSVSIYSLQFGNYPYLYYFETILGIVAFLSFIQVTGNRDSVIVQTISRISILIMALHSAISGYVGMINKFLYMSDETLLYGIIIALIEVAILYYPSKIIMRKWPILVGGR